MINIVHSKSLKSSRKQVPGHTLEGLLISSELLGRLRRDNLG